MFFYSYPAYRTYRAANTKDRLCRNRGVFLLSMRELYARQSVSIFVLGDIGKSLGITAWQ